MMSISGELLSRFKSEFASQIIKTFTGSVLVVILARLLSTEEYGLLFLAISIFGVLNVFSKLGLAKSGARYIAEYKSSNSNQIPHILKKSLKYNILTIGVVTAVLFLGHTLISDALGEPQLEPLLLIGTLYIIFGSLMTYVRLCFQGFEEIELSAFINAANNVIRLVIAVTMVGLGFGASGALLGYVLGFAVSSFIGFWLIYSRIYTDYISTESAAPDLGMQIFRYSIPLTLTSTADVIDRRIDTILVGFFLNPAAVSFYVVGKQAIQFIKTPLSALGFTISPTLGSQKAEGNIEKASEIYETALLHSLLLYIPAGAGLFLTAEHLIRLIFGAEYLNAVPVLQVMAIYGVFQSITQITSNGLDYLGRARARSISKGITAILNVTLNIVLIPRIGVVGAAIATVITFGIYTTINFYIIYTEFVLNPWRLAKSLVSIIGITLVMTLVIYPLTDIISGWGSLVVVVLVGVTVWAILVFGSGILGIRDSFGEIV
ncbi:flippase [Halobacteria archaeon HArc-gm2]|nr:flippase [Halobacteria archaeon HArc-gm2]